MIAALAHWRLAAGERDPWTLAPSARSTLGAAGAAGALGAPTAG